MSYSSSSSLPRNTRGRTTTSLIPDAETSSSFESAPDAFTDGRQQRRVVSGRTLPALLGYNVQTVASFLKLTDSTFSGDGLVEEYLLEKQMICQIFPYLIALIILGLRGK